MYSAVATGIFSVRNANRTTNGEIGRLPVAVGQTAGIVAESMRYNNIFSNTIKKAANVCKEVAESDKVFKGITKAVNFAKNNVNPLIVCSSGLNVLLANDKQSAVISETGNLSAMFLCDCGTIFLASIAAKEREVKESFSLENALFEVKSKSVELSNVLSNIIPPSYNLILE